MSTQQLLWLIAAILIGFPVFFVAIWSLVCWLIAQVGGWSRLARHYQAQTPPQGKRYDGLHGLVGMSSYKGVLNVVVGAEGLYLATMPFFRPAHPPLLIPWAALQSGEEWPFLWAQATRYTVVAPVGRAPLTTVTLPSLLFVGRTERPVA
jgi:hypothetical protein